ncbi:MAG: hypothetical protein IKC69_03910, partial [Clostridia bacterium]|nr:hypothetical protein [Clostridia bacterium]
MKRLGFFLLAVWMLLSLVACGAGQSKTEDEAPKVSLGTIDGEQITDGTTVRIKAMTGPTGMGLAALMHNDKAGAGNKCDYEVE